MKGIVVGQPFIVNAVDSDFKPLPNIDIRYGPYDNVNEALLAIPIKSRSLGVTAGIRDGNDIVEYWFTGGIENINFSKKNIGDKGNPGLPGDTYIPDFVNNVFDI